MGKREEDIQIEGEVKSTDGVFVKREGMEGERERF